MNANVSITPPVRFEFLRSEGSARDVGRQHGRTFGTQVRGSIGVYRNKFEKMGLGWAKALEMAARSGETLRGYDPGLFEELTGIAEGAEVDLREIVVINIRTGLTRMVEAAVAEDHECTSAAVLGEATANGHTLLGQNWDQSGVCQPNTVFIEQHIAGEPALMFVTEAGILFRHGMNEAGVGICGNALRSDREARADNGNPAPVARRRALRERNLADAVRVLRETPRSHSANHMMADAGGRAVDVESVPGDTFELEPEGGILVHSNHFQHERAKSSGLKDRGVISHPDTLYRDCRVRDYLVERRGRITVEDVKTAFKDHHGHPMSVCRHPAPGATGDDIGYTLVSTVMDLNERRMWTAPGPACVGTYTEYLFS